ncbi:uncharacterized protein LOC121796250 [Salvia splendens]|uniref:uncharacterized protein LOC121796250 n=1 Tax=Salvia splendens TaxID=180675 RepID=UPI001C269F72|nr:uncharacterized protein LOC121796250 [Salvia splendens]
MVVRIINNVKMVEETRTDQCSGVIRSPILVGWHPPATDTLKLNTEASLEGGSGRAYGGGLFRDATGSRSACSMVYILAKALGFQNLKVESDSFIGISMIKGYFEVSINCRSIVPGVRDLLPDFDSSVVNHLHREREFCCGFSISSYL